MCSMFRPMWPVYKVLLVQVFMPIPSLTILLVHIIHIFNWYLIFTNDLQKKVKVFVYSWFIGGLGTFEIKIWWLPKLDFWVTLKEQTIQVLLGFFLQGALAFFWIIHLLRGWLASDRKMIQLTSTFSASGERSCWLTWACWEGMCLPWKQLWIVW
jgi:hypothetical protein